MNPTGLFRRPKTLRGLLLRMLVIVLLGSAAIWHGVAGLRAHALVRSDPGHRPDWCVLPAGPCPERMWAAFPDLARETMSLTLPDGTLLHGWHLPSLNGRLVLLLHDYRANASAMLPLAAAIHADGTGVLAFDLPGHGRSGGERLRLDLADLELVAALWQQANALPGVKAGQVAVAGEGLGGALALLLGEQARPAPAMLLLSRPWLGLDRRWVQERTGLPAPLAWWVWRRLQWRLNGQDYQGRYLREQRGRLRRPMMWLGRPDELIAAMQWLAGVDTSRLWLRLRLPERADAEQHRRQLDELMAWMRTHWPEGPP